MIDQTKTEEEKAKEVVDLLSKFVNNMSYNPELIANEIMRQHRTLQQCIFNVFMKTIEKWAEANDQGRFDDRNEFTVKESKKIVKEVFGGSWFRAPFI